MFSSPGARCCQLQNAIRHLVQLGSLGVWGSYKMSFRMKYTAMRINAHFTGINSPNNQSILFLSNSCGMLLPGPWRKPPASWNLRFSRFSGEFHSSCLQYKHLIRTCQEPGLNIYGGFPPTSREALTPGARCVEVPTQKPRTSAIYYWGSLGV